MGGFCSVLDAVLCDESPPPEQNISGEHVRDLSSEIHDLEHNNAELMKQRAHLIRLLECIEAISSSGESSRSED